MHCEALAPGTEVVGGAERIPEGEDPSFRPPERDLLPDEPAADRNELERRDRRPWDDVMRNVEARRERRAIALVPIDQLENAGGNPCRADAIPQLLRVERVDQPDTALRNERVRATL